MILHTKNQGSRPGVFFHVAPYISLCKTCDPGWGNFWPKGYNLNKLGRSLLDNASYQKPRLYAV